LGRLLDRLPGRLGLTLDDLGGALLGLGGALLGDHRGLLGLLGQPVARGEEAFGELPGHLRLEARQAGERRKGRVLQQSPLQAGQLVEPVEVRLGGRGPDLNCGLQKLRRVAYERGKSGLGGGRHESPSSRSWCLHASTE
jgi:hypothetical protein